MKEGNLLKNLLCLLLLLASSGCSNFNENPKVQGARQIAQLEEEGRKIVLHEGKKLLERDTDPIL